MTPKRSISTNVNISQLKTIQQNFVKELKAANAGKKTSLPFIIHKLSSLPIVKDGEVFQALVIGGSIFKRALCRKVKDRISILKKETEKPLSFKTENEFLRFIEREMYSDVNVLTLNFAYPLKPVFEKGKLDGILLAVTKEGGFHGLVGKQIGKEIERYILAKRNKKIKVAVANDTVCLLTSGLSKFKKENLAAGIVGTGFNIAFFISRDELVNLESANFDKFPRSQEGRIIDKQSAKPGKSLFEKETAGAYLYKHFNLIIKEKKIKYPQISSTEELDRISRKKIPQVSEIAKNLITRSAQLVACQIAGIAEFKQIRHSGEPRFDRGDSRIPKGNKRFWTSQNDEKTRGIIFNMEGSLFWNANNYKETVEQTVKKLILEYSVKFVEIENSAILGAAKLVA